MKDELIKPASSGISHIFKIFLLGGFCISVVTFSLYWMGDVIWADFIHSNPNRTYRETWETLSISPVLGIILVLENLSLALVTGAIVAAFGYKLLRHLPFWYLLILLPACMGAVYLQQQYMRTPLGDEIVWNYYIKMITPHLMIYLLGCWWFSCKLYRV